MAKKVRGLNIDDTYYEKLKKIADEEKRSCSNMLEILIDMYEKMKKEGK